MKNTLPPDVALLLDAASDRYGIPRAFARAVAWTESRGSQVARGTSGELGVMQLMAATAKSLQVDASDLVQNIDGGVRLLSQLMRQYGEESGIAAYNAGPHVGQKPRASWPASTRRYVDLVLARAELENAQMGGRSAAAPLGATATTQLQPSLSPPPVPPLAAPSLPPKPPRPPSGEDGGNA